MIFIIDQHLLMKVVMLVSLFCLARSCEVADLTWNDVTFDEKGITISIGRQKTLKNGVRVLRLIPKEFSGKNTILLFDAYHNQLLQHNGSLVINRLFQRYDNRAGHFTASPVGKNTISLMPQMIAQFLGLENSQSYTGHSFRRTAATLMANNGAEQPLLMAAGTWKTVASANRYVSDSAPIRENISKKICPVEASLKKYSALSSKLAETHMGSMSVAPLAFLGGSFHSCTISVVTGKASAADMMGQQVAEMVADAVNDDDCAIQKALAQEEKKASVSPADIAAGSAKDREGVVTQPGDDSTAESFDDVFEKPPKKLRKMAPVSKKKTGVVEKKKKKKGDSCEKKCVRKRS